MYPTENMKNDAIENPRHSEAGSLPRLFWGAMLTFATMFFSTTAFSGGVTCVGKNGRLYVWKPVEYMKERYLGPQGPHHELWEFEWRLEAKNFTGQNDEYYFVNLIYLPAGTFVGIYDAPKGRENEPFIEFNLLRDGVFQVDLKKLENIHRRSQVDEKAIRKLTAQGFVPAADRSEDPIDMGDWKQGRLHGKVSHIHIKGKYVIPPYWRHLKDRFFISLSELNSLWPYDSKDLPGGRERDNNSLEFVTLNGNRYRFHKPMVTPLAPVGVSGARFSVLMRTDHNKTADRDDYHVMAYELDTTGNVFSSYDDVHMGDTVASQVSAAASTVNTAATWAGVLGTASAGAGYAAAAVAVLADATGRTANIVANISETGGRISLKHQSLLKSYTILSALKDIARP